MSNTMTIPKKAPSEDMLPPRNAKQVLERYQLQVDRLTKSSFKAKEDAEKAGGVIKKSFPKLHVSIYDAQLSETTVI